MAMTLSTTHHNLLRYTTYPAAVSISLRTNVYASNNAEAHLRFPSEILLQSESFEGLRNMFQEQEI